MIDKKELIKSIRKDLKMPEEINESYVVQARSYNLPTEYLSQKTKVAHQELLDGYVNSLNQVSAELDVANREEANLNHSNYRSLKIDETYNLNAAFLHAMYFENISDLYSEITMNSLAFMRLERDFGTFDAWQKDFIACCMSARNGWGMTVYNTFLDRYMNGVVDVHSLNVPISAIPVIFMDAWEHAYYKDYLKDRKAYVYAMMTQLNWGKIEERFIKADKVAKVLK